MAGRELAWHGITKRTMRRLDRHGQERPERLGVERK
jgi:hypothetical protein